MDDTTQEVVADAKAVRELKIKAGILKRNLKDFNYYKKDMDQQKAKFDQMTEAGAEESELKKYKQGVEETTGVFFTCKPRIEDALSIVENLLGTYGEGQGLGAGSVSSDSTQVLALKATPEWQAAEEQVSEAKLVLDSMDSWRKKSIEL